MYFLVLSIYFKLKTCTHFKVQSDLLTDIILISKSFKISFLGYYLLILNICTISEVNTIYVNPMLLSNFDVILK